jgi:hypothetical protein
MGKKSQKFAKMRAFLAKIRKNVRFLTPFFKPPCAFDAKWTIRISYLARGVRRAGFGVGNFFVIILLQSPLRELFEVENSSLLTADGAEVF